MNISEIVAQPQPVTWLPWAVQYFFFIGVSTCAVLVACGVRWVQPAWRERIEGTCLFLALTCGITAPLALTADLHQTARFWHFYAWPTPWSWMPWGALLLPLFTLLVGAWFVLFHLRKLTGRETPWRRWIAVASAIAAIGLLLYTGREVSVVRARPLWFSYWFPLVMFISAMCALLAMLALIYRRHSGLMRPLAQGQLAMLALLGGCLLAWYHGETLSGAALRQQWHLASTIRSDLIAGILLCAAAMAIALYSCCRVPPRVLLLINVVIVAGLCWLLRWTWLIGGQVIPKYNALSNDYPLPMGTDGLLAIVGTFGLWLALMIVIGECVNWFSRRVQHG